MSFLSKKEIMGLNKAEFTNRNENYQVTINFQNIYMITSFTQPCILFVPTKFINDQTCEYVKKRTIICEIEHRIGSCSRGFLLHAKL